LIEGLSTDTTITDPSGMELFDFLQRTFEQAQSEAITEEAITEEDQAPAAQRSSLR
jgi:hypothetical protein